jgi:hypothetical protein
MHIRVVRFLNFLGGHTPNPLPGGGEPPPGPTPSTASGAFGASGRAGRASRAQPPPYANPGYATDSDRRLAFALACISVVKMSTS